MNSKDPHIKQGKEKERNKVKPSINTTDTSITLSDTTRTTSGMTSTEIKI